MQPIIHSLSWSRKSLCKITDKFVPQGVEINAKNYIDSILETGVSGAGNSLFKNEDWTFQQDSATAHSTKITQSWFCDRNIIVTV